MIEMALFLLVFPVLLVVLPWGFWFWCFPWIAHHYSVFSVAAVASTHRSESESSKVDQGVEMIRLVRTHTAAAGKLPQLTQIGKEVAAHINERESNSAVSLFIEMFGRQRVHVTADFDDLSALEAFIERNNADQELREMAAKLESFMVDGSMHDTVVQAA